MNQAHLHLVFNHLPIIVPIVGFLVMIGGFVFSSDVVKRTAYSIFILGAICTMPAFFTGEGAEEVVENIPTVTENLIHEHEEAAEVLAILSYFLGALSIVGLWANLKQKSFAGILSYVTILLCVVILYFGKQTGTTGGEIRHTEIRTGGDTGTTNPELNGGVKKKDGDDD